MHHIPLSASDRSEIRVVKLYPGKFDDDIRCELVHVSLASSELVSHIALSYTWGSPDATAPILLGGRSFQVTRNLESFLRHAQCMALVVAERLPEVLRQEGPACAMLRNELMLRILQDPKWPRSFSPTTSPEFVELLRSHISGLGFDEDDTDPPVLDDPSRASDLDSSYLTFWIDAICINQRDTSEKSQQVSRMKDIYSGSMWVWIWLGECWSPDNVDLILDLGNDLVQQLAQDVESPDRRAWFTDTVKRITGEDFVRERISALKSLSNELLARDWFTRVWVLQETATVRGKIVALIGFHPFRWGFLMHVLGQLCMDMTRSWQSSPLYIDFLTMGQNLLTFREVSMEYADLLKDRASPENAQAVNVPERLQSLLRHTCGVFKASDPRDLIYGLLGLLGTHDIPEELLPDYNAPVGQVFHKAAAYLVKYTQQVDFLHFAKREFADVPSWVPDWRYVKRSRRDAEIPRNLSGAKVTDDGLGLILEGITLGTIVTVVHPVDIAAVIGETIIGQGLSPDIDDEDRHELVLQGIWTTFQAIRLFKKHLLEQAQIDMPTLSLEAFQEGWERLWPGSTERYRALFQMIDGELEPDLKQLVEEPLGPMVVLLGELIMELAVTGLAITDGLEMLISVWLENPIHEGDVVVLAGGIPVPCILRPQNEKFTFVGVSDLYSFQLDRVNELPDDSLSSSPKKHFMVI